MHERKLNFSVKTHDIDLAKIIFRQSEDKPKCIKFYMNNILNFKDNVIGKLNSLVYNYDDL